MFCVYLKLMYSYIDGYFSMVMDFLILFLNLIFKVIFKLIL